MTRKLKLKDLPVVQKIHKREFPLPDITDYSYIGQGALVNKDDEIQGAFFVRVTSELILILDEKLSRISRARYIKEAASDIKRGLLTHGIKSTHVFVTPETDIKHAEALKKHFGFVEATGIPLYWEVSDG